MGEIGESQSISASRVSVSPGQCSKRKKLIGIVTITVLSLSIKGQTIQDKQTINKLCGCFEVEFKYAETFSPDASYKFHDRDEISGGLELVLPPFEGDAAALRGAHEGALALCDAVLVYYGAGSRTWLRAVEVDLRRLAHVRKGRPAPVRAICVAAPDNADKEALVASRAAGLIDLRGGRQAESLVSFVQALRNEGVSA